MPLTIAAGALFGAAAMALSHRVAPGTAVTNFHDGRDNLSRRSVSFRRKECGLWVLAGEPVSERGASRALRR